MRITAHVKNARMAPRKMRLLRKALVGLPVREARAQLQWQPGKGAGIILGALNSAVANATHNLELREENLRLADLTIDKGVVYKRFRPVSRGMAHAYVKRASHVTVVLGEIAPQRRARRRAKSAIDTVTVEALQKEAAVQKVPGQPEGPKQAAFPPGGRSAAEEAYQRTKMLQQGGDRKKTHRRKSV